MPAEIVRRKGSDDGGEGGAPAWMVTFSDMVTLLLTFFILIVAYSAIEEPNFGRAMGSLRGALGGAGGLLLSQTESEATEIKLTDVADEVPDGESVYLTDTKKEFINEFVKVVKNMEQQFGNVEVSLSKYGLEVRISADVLFKPGSAKILPSAYSFIDAFAKLIKDTQDDVSVEGHSDNVAVDENAYFGWGKGLERYTSNWDLSSARAVNVVEYLVAKGVNKERLKAIGLADTKPIEDNSTPQGRKKNRRVVLFISQDPRLMDEEKKVIKDQFQKLGMDNVLAKDSKDQEDPEEVAAGTN